MGNLKVAGLDIGSHNLTIDESSGTLLVDGSEVSGSGGGGGINYVWIDEAARLAQTGMSADKQGIQQDTGIVYKYNGTAWVEHYSVGIRVDSSRFTKNLSVNDNTIQKAFETIDGLVLNSTLTPTPQLSLTSGSFASESTFNITIQNYDATASYFITETEDDLTSSANRSGNIITVILGEVTDGIEHAYSFNVTAQVSGSGVSNSATVNITVKPLSLVSDAAIVWQRDVDVDTDPTESIVNTGTETQEGSDGDWGQYQNILYLEPTDIFVEKISNTEIIVNHPIDTSNSLYLYDGATLEEREVSSVVKIDKTGTHDIFSDGSAVATYLLDGNATDLGGNYDGIAGNVSYEKGKLGQAAVIPAGGYIHNQGINLGTTGTISAWVKIKNDVGAGFIFSLGGDSGSRSILCYTNGNNKYNIAQGSSIGGTLHSNANLSLNEWVHITMVFTASEYKLYVNGSLDKTFSPSSNVLDLNPGFAFGAISNLHYSYLNLNANFDQVRVFNRALTATEVNTLYRDINAYKVVIPTYTPNDVDLLRIKTFIKPTTKTALKATNDITSTDLVEDVRESEIYTEDTNLLQINYLATSSGQGRYIESEISDVVTDSDVKQLTTNVWELQ